MNRVMESAGPADNKKYETYFKLDGEVTGCLLKISEIVGELNRSVKDIDPDGSHDVLYGNFRKRSVSLERAAQRLFNIIQSIDTEYKEVK